MIILRINKYEGQKIKLENQSYTFFTQKEGRKQFGYIYIKDDIDLDTSMSVRLLLNLKQKHIINYFGSKRLIQYRRHSDTSKSAYFSISGCKKLIRLSDHKNENIGKVGIEILILAEENGIFINGQKLIYDQDFKKETIYEAIYLYVINIF